MLRIDFYCIIDLRSIGVMLSDASGRYPQSSVLELSGEQVTGIVAFDVAFLLRAVWQNGGGLGANNLDPGAYVPTIRSDGNFPNEAPATQIRVLTPAMNYLDRSAAIEFETWRNEHQRPTCMFSFNVSVLEPSESSTVIWLRDVEAQAEIGAVRYFIDRLCDEIALTGAWGFEYSCDSFTNCV
ncbi:hypothetical protein [Roseovarius sp.]|uniref:hypothetical protein n=1 Tax=Roseovarius sp. TaxID=1486281 RepID=UPI003D0BAA03